MTLKINYNDSNLTIPRLDGGGIPIYDYNGTPFTGIVFENYDTGALFKEEEYDKGYQEGWVRYYHKNGKKSEEYKAHNNNVIPNTHKEWDENGNLIWESKS